MAHVAIVTIPGIGHVNPTIDVIVELIARGHRVSFAVPAGFGQSAQGAGAALVAYDSLLTKRPDHTTTAEEFALYLPFILLTESSHVLPQLTRAFATDVPDVVLYDRTAYVTGRALGELWDRRTIELFPSFAYSEKFSLAAVTDQRSVLDPADEAYRALQAQLADFATNTGTSAVGVHELALGLADEAIVFVPPSFQPARESFGAGYSFVGPCLRTRRNASDLRGSASDADSTSMYASLGTAFTDRCEAYAAIVEAMGSIDSPSVLSLGGASEADVLGGGLRTAGNIRVEEMVDQLAALAHANVFVTHAGMGGVLEALTFGVPLVCLPGTTEQQIVARRVAELGLGLDLGPSLPAPHDLAAAIQHARTDPDIRRNLERMQLEVSHARGALEAADRIECCLPSARRS